MEFFNLGNLNEYLTNYFPKAEGKSLTPKIFKKIFYKISSALNCLHEAGYIHMDIKE